MSVFFSKRSTCGKSCHSACTREDTTVLTADNIYAGRTKSEPVHGKCSRNGDSLPPPQPRLRAGPVLHGLATQTKWLIVHTNSSVHIFPRNFQGDGG